MKCRQCSTRPDPAFVFFFTQPLHSSSTVSDVIPFGRTIPLPDNNMPIVIVRSDLRYLKGA